MAFNRTIVWLLRVLWATLPFTVGPALADALDGADRPVQLVASIGLWGLWAVGLGVALVPTTVTLTALRLLAPGPLAGALVALVVEPGLAGVIASLTGLAVVGLALRGEVGQVFVDGSSYGDERRFPLRPPGPLVLGPLPVMWLALAGSAAAGPLLLAAGTWVVGTVAMVVALALLAVLPRRLHQLSRRFLVFVPAGLAVHDQLVLAETAMFRWGAVAGLSQALADNDALDLTASALGPAVQVRLHHPEAIVVAGRWNGRGAGPAERVQAAAVLCSPTLTRATLDEADRRQRR